MHIVNCSFLWCQPDAAGTTLSKPEHAPSEASLSQLQSLAKHPLCFWHPASSPSSAPWPELIRQTTQGQLVHGLTYGLAGKAELE